MEKSEIYETEIVTEKPDNYRLTSVRWYILLFNGFALWGSYYSGGIGNILI